jgi:hypothetical protein
LASPNNVIPQKSSLRQSRPMAAHIETDSNSRTTDLRV